MDWSKARTEVEEVHGLEFKLKFYGHIPGGLYSILSDLRIQLNRQQLPILDHIPLAQIQSHGQEQTIREKHLYWM